MKEKFEYKYNAPSMEERKEIDNIRNQYLPKEEVSKFELLKRLHRKVNETPIIVGLSLGIIGTLLFGTGLSFFLVEEFASFWFVGIPFSILGIVGIAFAYPIYKKIHNKLKEKHKEEIINLSNELLNEYKD